MILSTAALLRGIIVGFPLPSFNFDGRYFFAASDCVIAGRSPYEIGAFFECWENRTGTPQRSTFVFPPLTLLPTLPLALFDRPLADMFLLILQFAIFGVLAFWSADLIKRLDLDRRRQWTATLWLGLALTNTGVFGSVYLGQLGLFSGAGLVAISNAVSGVGRGGWAAGILLAAVKPHLSVIACLGAFLGTRGRDRGRKLLAVFLLVAANIWIFVLDPNFLESFRESLRFHAESQYSKVSVADELFGFPGLLRSLNLHWIIVMTGALAVWSGAAWLLADRNMSRGTRRAVAFSALVIAGAFLVPHKQYDFAIYSIVFLTTARLGLPIQALLLPVLVVVWRPAVLSNVGIDTIIGTDLCLILVFCVHSIVALRAVVQR